MNEYLNYFSVTFPFWMAGQPCLSLHYRQCKCTLVVSVKVSVTIPCKSVCSLNCGTFSRLAILLVYEIVVKSKRQPKNNPVQCRHRGMTVNWFYLVGCCASFWSGTAQAAFAAHSLRTLDPVPVHLVSICTSNNSTGLLYCTHAHHDTGCANRD